MDGKHTGSRRAEKPPERGRARLLLLAAGTTGCLIGWGYLVFAAIDFGRTARSGDGAAWLFLALASLGAVACLFAALLLALRVVGALRGDPVDPESVRPTGGRRARR